MHTMHTDEGPNQIFPTCMWRSAAYGSVRFSRKSVLPQPSFRYLFSNGDPYAAVTGEKRSAAD